MTLNLKDFVHDVPDFPKAGILFRDITPMLADGPAFAAAIDQLDELTRGIDYTRIIGIESRGFIFGAALAQKRKCGFVPIRKPKKLPRATVRETYSLEYGEDTLEMHEDALIKGERALIVDDVLGVIRRLKQQGIAAIVVEQNSDIALSVADSVVVLSQGQVAWKGTAATLSADPGLKRKLLGGLA